MICAGTYETHPDRESEKGKVHITTLDKFRLNAEENPFPQKNGQGVEVDGY